MKPNKPASAPDRPIEGNGSFLIGYQLKQKHVLVIGGGKEAANRTFFALDSDAFVTVISPPPLHPAVQKRYEKGLLRWINREFVDSDLELQWDTPTNSQWPVDMVLGCIDDHVESRRIALLARSKRIPVNCADIPELCDFYFMAQFRQEQLQIAISTNGGGPRLGVRIRNSIVERLDPNTPAAVTMIGKLREQIRQVDDKELQRSGTQVIESRMGWVSRFCDSWSFKQLTTLQDPVVMNQVIDAFRYGREAPESKVKDDAIKQSMLLPPTLTSFWWCPKNMGYFAWLKMFSKYCFRVGYQVTRLIFMHASLPFQIRRWFLPSPQVSKVEKEPIVVSTRIVPTNQKEASTQNSVVAVHQSAQASAVQHDNASQSEIKQFVASHAQASIVLTDNESQTSQEPAQLTITPTNQVIVESVESIAEELEQKPRSESSDDTLDHITGKVYLVGAGPGHPDMLTLQALKVLESADLVVSDRLIPQPILDLIPPKKLVLSSFKVGGQSDKAQDQSNEICLHAALQGKTVVRLKTGDPFVFGRGGEEVLFFRHYDIEAIVVPGLSSVFAAPAVANIPVTHREVADQVLIMSGRGKGGSFPHIPHFYANRTTIFLMSLSRINELVKKMEEKEYPLDLPCAVIEKGTWAKGQAVCLGTLETIGKNISEQKIENPAMLIVGDVISVLGQTF